MTLYFIGLGLGNENDITLNGLEAVKKCDVVYLENYTSVLSCKKEDYEGLFGKKIILAGRTLVESCEKENKILENAKKSDVALLVGGDPLVATTHIGLLLSAKKQGIRCKVIHNSSIICAVGIIGLQPYKFGKVTSIPLENENIESPYDILKDNLSLGMHTLFLLDFESNGLDNNNDNRKFVSINDAIRYLLKVELKRNEKIFNEKTFCVGCARLGTNNQTIKFGAAQILLKHNFYKPPHCLIVPGKLHFMEEEMLGLHEEI